MWTTGWGNKYFVTEGKGNKYFVNKREEIITLLMDELCELKGGNWLLCDLWTKGEEIITICIDKKRRKHFLNDGEENKYFVNYSGGTIYFVDDGLRE